MDLSRKISCNLSPALLVMLSAMWTGACKTRSDQDAGLLSSQQSHTGEPADEAGAAGPAAGGPGVWRIECTPEEESATQYSLTVAGAINPRDESQELSVTVSRVVESQQAFVTEQLQGHGAVDPAGTVFVGFSAGVLNAEYQPAGGQSHGNATHKGLLTLDEVAGLAVDCRIQAL